jgi:NADP-dependent 3-hydroxy acid dehydrogenase YdfG
VVTGASSGIGAATAKLLAQEGWRVVLVARRAERLEELAAAIAEAGGGASAEVLDAADGAAVMAMAERVRSKWGAPSLVVNSAGAGKWRYLEETSVEEIVEMMGAPYLAAANICRAFMDDMLAAKRGLFVHVGSPASLVPWPGATAYSGSRWALRGLHEALCQDLRGTGLRSSLVYFGEVSSEYFEANPGSHEHIPTLAAPIPVSTPERCAEVLLGVVHRPRRVVFYPFALRLMALFAAIAPAPTRWLAARTGRRH